MNPRSGGGKVERFRLKEAAEALGAEVVLLLLNWPGEAEVRRPAEDAEVQGADLLGVAGRDGTQALVAVLSSPRFLYRIEEEDRE